MDHLVSNIHCSVYREQVFLTWYSDIYVPTGVCQHHLGLSQTCCSRVSHPQLAHEAWNNQMERILSTKTGNLSELSSSVLCALSSEARFSMVPMIAAGKPWQNPKQSDYSSVYLRILNMNRSFIQTRRFRRIHLSVFRYRLIKNALTGPERFLGILRNGPKGQKSIRAWCTAKIRREKKQKKQY